MKLRKIAAAVLSLSLVCGAVPFSNDFVNDSAVYAESEYTEGTYGVLTYKNYGDYIEITGCNSDITEINIPTKIEGIVVTAIGDYAFENSHITSLVIPNTVTTIGSFAFSFCKNLAIITIPNSVTSINGMAFYNCTSLINITIPNSVTSIGGMAFYNCTSLTNVTIPKSITSIGNAAFYNTIWLEKQRSINPLVIVNNILIDGLYAQKDVIIPNGVTSIGAGAFNSCETLSSIVIPQSVTSIESQAFMDCHSLTSISIPQSVTSIGLGAFSGCNSLTSITISKNISSIEESTFLNCKSLKSITILNPDCKICDMSYTISNGYDNQYEKYYYTGTIYGYDNSTAQAYAEKYGYKFESLGEYVETLLGDTDNDGVINSSDASNVLAAYAKTATGGESPFTEAQIKAADVNNDGAVDSSDASSILAYYAYTATGGQGTMEEFLN